MPKYLSKDRSVIVSGSGPGGVAVEVSFEKGSYTTKDEAEAFVLDALALLPDSPVSFDQKED